MRSQQQQGGTKRHGWTLVATMVMMMMVMFNVVVQCQEVESVSSVAPNTTTVTLGYNMRSYGEVTARTLEFFGDGPNWKNISGVPSFWINYPQPFQVLYQNNLTEESIIHVHGQKQPIGEDGVPFISAPPMTVGSEIYSTFPLENIEDFGTYWMHSHFMFQQTEGLAAPFIVNAPIDPDYPFAEMLEEAETVVMFLEDFCAKYADDPSPYDCNCTKAYEMLVADFINETGNGTIPFPTCPNVDPATDMDVMFAAVVANRKTIDDPVIVPVTPGQYVRVRIINASSMTNFYLRLPLNGLIVATDGQMTTPIFKDNVWIAVAQRLDILFQIPSDADEGTNYIITAQGESLDSSYIRVAGIALQIAYDKTSIQPIPPVNVQQFPLPGFMNASDELTYNAFYPLSPATPDKSFFLNLTGDNGFKSINGYSFQLYPMVPAGTPNPHPLRVKYGDRVHITLFNQNPDNHAFHMHGHSFQIIEINGTPINGAMRDTVLVPQACGSVTIAFDAINPGVWLFHCHMEFHMMAGMITTVEYYDD